MNECFEFEIGLEALLDFIVTNDQENIESRSLESKSIDYLQQKVLEHQASFNTNEDTFTGMKCFGSIKEKPGYLEVTILKNVFDNWITEGGFSSQQVVLKGLKKEGFLDHETGKNTRMRKVSGEDGHASKKTVYVLKMPKDLLDAVSAAPTYKKSPLPKKNKLPKLGDAERNIDDILSDMD